MNDGHKLTDCYAKTHFDWTVLSVMGDVEECDEEVSAEISSTFNICCDSELEQLMFIQPHMYSLAEKQNMCSNNVLQKVSPQLMWLAMVILLHKFTRLKLQSESDTMQGWKPQIIKDIFQAMDGCGSIQMG